MTKANLLNTETKNFQDLLGNGRNYRVPRYQRDYSWTEEQWEDLWLDVCELRPDSSSRHYMGAVVVKAESDREFLIIDGQQRIATLTILGLAVIARLNQLATEHGEIENQTRADALRARFIGEKDPASLVEISKLVLNENDDGFFQDYLVQLRRPANPRALPRSNKLLWNCYEYFEKRISADSALSTDGLRLAELLSEVVARRLLFILITVEDEISAYTVFETLNARGLELTTTDLLKNYLFSRLKSPSDLKALQRRWQRLISTVRQERFGDFIRYHYLTLRRQIRSGRLFKIVRDDVKTPDQVLALIDVLESRAELFDALGDPNHSLWSENREAIGYIRQLALFRVKQMMPLLFAVYEKFEAYEFVRVLKIVTLISFRYSTISGLNTNELEPVYHDAARKVLNGESITARQVFESLRGIYVQDKKFEADFAQAEFATSGTRKKLTKYILATLESDLSNRNIDFETDPGTVEHILPENPGDDWEESIPRDKWGDYVYRLGNLTLLSAPENRRIANFAYAEKKDTYSESEYALTNQIVDDAPENWSIDLIEARQNRMAKRAVHAWRIDFE